MPTFGVPLTVLLAWLIVLVELSIQLSNEGDVFTVGLSAALVGVQQDLMLVRGGGHELEWRCTLEVVVDVLLHS